MDIGCKNILILSNAVGYAAEDVCHNVVRKCGRTVRTHTVRPMPDEDHIGMTMDFLEEHPEIDAIFSLTDWRLAGVVPSLLKKGYRIPDDLALVGYYNTPWSRLPGMELTSVSTRPDHIVSEACDLISQGRFDVQRTIKPKLIIRESSRRERKQ